MKNNKIRVIAIIFLVLIVGWQLYTKYDKANVKEQNLKQNYQEVKAIVKMVTPSGVRAKRTTILFVEYNLNKETKTTTIRRSGYIEGAYNKGDTVTIYVNPNNLDDIK